LLVQFAEECAKVAAYELPLERCGKGFIVVVESEGTSFESE
jgi:hypothetical protein